MIIDLALNSIQGIISYHSIDREHGTIEIGAIHYSKYLQKTRVTTEVIYLMLCHIFNELGYRRCQWRCNVLNNASRNAAERLGFIFEGILRQSHVYKGYNRDTAVYSILDSEWPSLKYRFEKWLMPDNFDEIGKQKIRLQEILKEK